VAGAARGQHGVAVQSRHVQVEQQHVRADGGGDSVVTPTGVFTGYNAGPGWDPVTGWGSPNAQYLVPLLAHTARAPAQMRAAASPPAS
jgi:hypothetical protein